MKTDWGDVAGWYDNHLKEKDTYHTKVVIPGVVRLLGDIKGKRVLDLACGNGIISSFIKKQGAIVSGVDKGGDLIKIAKDKFKDIDFYVGDAEKLSETFKGVKFDTVVCVLAIQNIKSLDNVFSSVDNVLEKGGRFIFVLNHPAFRVPKKSNWVFHSNYNAREIKEYMTESSIKIDMEPGSDDKNKKYTYSFHRPLQSYFKSLRKNNLSVTHLEEWISHKRSESGPKKEIEDKARKEFPMFMVIEAVKL